jgi:hypothetical protein
VGGDRGSGWTPLACLPRTWGAPMSKTRGSEKRARNGWLAMRSSPEEEAEIRKKAADAGVSVSELMRAATLGYRLPASKIDMAAFNHALAMCARIEAEAGKQGSLYNQTVHALNAGRPPERLMGLLESGLNNLDMVHRDMLEIRRAILDALGIERRRKRED